MPEREAMEPAWLLGELSRLGRLMHGPGDRTASFPSVVRELASTLGARSGVLFRATGETLEPLSAGEPAFAALEGLARVAAGERRGLSRVDAESGALLAQPVLFEGRCLAVLAFALARPPGESQQGLLALVAEQLALAWAASESQAATMATLEHYRGIAGELQRQQEKLSGEMREVAQKNREVEQSKAAVEERVEQLALSSRYKSEFLANMSHELRTPLNSLLILAKLLADNHERNLTRKQVDYARTILAAGTDLLSLINDILDLAKVESGTVTLNIAPERFVDLEEYVESNFRPMATGKGLAFEVKLDAALPPAMETDSKRLRQILKNLLSNAFKFTEQGSVRLEVAPAVAGWSEGHALGESGPVIAFSVVDTGIGIARDKQKIIFEEFQQADGTTSRQYGGTGLGLSISRELARLLGGEIGVESVPGQGSRFVLYVPQVHDWVRRPAAVAESPSVAPDRERAVRPADDRRSIAAGDRVVVIAEAGAAPGAALLSLARERGFKGVIAPDAASTVSAARDLAPDALLLRAESAAGIFDALAEDAVASRIAVRLAHRQSATASQQCREARVAWSADKALERTALHEALAAAGRLAGRAARRIVVADADAGRGDSISQWLREEEYAVHVVSTRAALLAELDRPEPPELLLVAATLEDGSAGDVAAALLQREPLAAIPWLFHRGPGTEPGRRARIEIWMPRAHGSLREALDDVASRIDEETRELISSEASAAPAATAAAPEGVRLAGKTALIIDDDIRNIFALTSALEHYGMQVIYAESARQGIDMLRQRHDVSVALVDVMMPEIDGYDAIRIIRGMDGMASLPIIAVTAKAMKGDREKCIAAGASDYLSKPVKIDQLLGQLHAWVK